MTLREVVDFLQSLLHKRRKVKAAGKLFDTYDINNDGRTYTWNISANAPATVTHSISSTASTAYSDWLPVSRITPSTIKWVAGQPSTQKICTRCGRVFDKPQQYRRCDDTGSLGGYECRRSCRDARAA